MGWLNAEELKKFKYVGKNVLISDKTEIHGHHNIEIGDHVRIDAFSVLLASNGFILIGSHVHISTHVHLNGGGGISLQDHAQIATHCRLISATDDFSGESLVGPCVPDSYRKVNRATIFMRRLSVLGAGTTVLPGIEIREGTAVGANSLVNKTTGEYEIYVGTPAKKIGNRNAFCHALAHELLEKDLGLAPKK